MRANGRSAGWAILLGLLLTVTGAGLAHAQLPSQPGDEIGVGKNATGETCRLRLRMASKENLLVHVYSLCCEGWTAPSGELRHFRAFPSFPPSKLVTDSGWFTFISERVVGCRDPEPTTLIGASPGALRQCVREPGGWPVVIAAAHVGPKAYTLEAAPTNIRVLERAAEILERRRPPERLDEREGAVSAAIRRAEAIVGASGRLIGVADIGTLQTTYELADRYWRALNIAAADAAYRRLIETSERLLGPTDPAVGPMLGALARTVSSDGRFSEADQLFARAEPLVLKSLAVDDHPLHLARVSWHLQYQRRFAEAITPAEQSLTLREGRNPKSHGTGHSLFTLASAYRGLKAERSRERSR